jgi:hypothetical protein
VCSAIVILDGPNDHRLADPVTCAFVQTGEGTRSTQLPFQRRPNPRFYTIIFPPHRPRPRFLSPFCCSPVHALQFVWVHRASFERGNREAGLYRWRSVESSFQPPPSPRCRGDAAVSMCNCSIFSFFHKRNDNSCGVRLHGAQHRGGGRRVEAAFYSPPPLETRIPSPAPK